MVAERTDGRRGERQAGNRADRQKRFKNSAGHDFLPLMCCVVASPKAIAIIGFFPLSRTRPRSQILL
jgi:hypothetical protein